MDFIKVYSIVAIEFHGQQLLAAKTKDGIFIAMKPIVTGMGLTWQGQLEKLKKNADKFNYNHMVIVANDSKQREMGVIPLRKLNSWLFSVNPEKVNSAEKARVSALNNEMMLVNEPSLYGLVFNA